MTDQDLIAQFLAKGGAIQTAPVGIAYGVDKDADKAKRRAARERERDECFEQAAERHAEAVREAAHVGGRSAAIEALNAPRVRWERF